MKLVELSWSRIPNIFFQPISTTIVFNIRDFSTRIGDRRAKSAEYFRSTQVFVKHRSSIYALHKKARKFRLSVYLVFITLIFHEFTDSMVAVSTLPSSRLISASGFTQCSQELMLSCFS